MTIPADSPVRKGRAVPATTKTYGHTAEVVAVPNLIQIQLDSFEWFKREGLRELLDEINPIQDFSGTRMELRFRRLLPPSMSRGHILASPAVNSDGEVILDAGVTITDEHVTMLAGAG